MLRKTNGKCYIWGKPAKFIKTEYETSDGKVHNSLLLTSGFWGKKLTDFDFFNFLEKDCQDISIIWEIYS